MLVSDVFVSFDLPELRVVYPMGKASIPDVQIPIHPISGSPIDQRRVIYTIPRLKKQRKTFLLLRTSIAPVVTIERNVHTG